MQFPNAYKCVKKLFAAEILSLVAQALVLVFAVLTAVAVFSTNEETTTVTAIVDIVLMVAAGIISIVSFFIMVFGLGQGKQDEPRFKTALFLVFFGLALSICASVIINPTIRGLFELLVNVMEFTVTLYVIQGIVNLARKLGNEETINRGAKIFKLILAFTSISLLAEVVKVIFVFTSFAQTISAVLSLASAFISIVAYFIYLKFLSRAKKMLKE